MNSQCSVCGKGDDGRAQIRKGAPQCSEKCEQAVRQGSRAVAELRVALGRIPAWTGEPE